MRSPSPQRCTRQAAGRGREAGVAGQLTSRRVPLALCLCALASLPATPEAYIGAIDLGSQYFKAAIVKPGKPFEVVHNQHSKRKTPTAVSFHEAVRTFGDDAVSSASKGAVKTPMFFSLQLGRNLTAVPSESYGWLPAAFYPYKFAKTEYGGLTFVFNEETNFTVEETAAHVLNFAKQLSNLAADGGKMTDSVLTIPSGATYHQRLALITAAEMAALPRPQLVHETSAAALQRALDLDYSGVNGTRNESYTLFYNMGARHVEACIVHYRGATWSGKSTIAMEILGCGHNDEVGGHHIDLILAKEMLKGFQAKQPKLADGIVTSVRALRKLEKEALGAKHVLSANKEALFRVESLYEDTDFSQPITREQLENLCAKMFESISQPVEAALKSANVTLADIDEVEMIGGGWRVPRVQTLLSDYFKSQRPADLPPLNLSQHVNGEEGIATGAAFFAANSSVSFRVKRIFYTDVSPYRYSLSVTPLNSTEATEAGWQRSVELFPAKSKLGSRKTIKVNVSFDLRLTLREEDNIVAIWDLNGIHEAATGKYANLSTPLVSMKLELDSSGMVRLSQAQAIFDEEVNVTVPAGGAGLTAAKKVASTNTSSNDTDETSNATSEAQEAEESSADADAADEGASGSEEGAASAENGTDSSPTANQSSNESATEPTVKTKIKKRKVTLQVTDHPEGLRMTEEARTEAVKRLLAMDRADAEVQRLDAAKNTFESFIYEARGKLSDDEYVLQVSEEAKREEVMGSLTTMEEWLYEDGFYVTNASEFEDKLDELHLLVDPILRRAKELELRPQVQEVVDKVLQAVNRTLEYVRKNMTWVAASEREGLANQTAKFEEWYSNVTKEQASQPLTAEPAFTVNEVQSRLQRLSVEATRLQKIKKIDYDYSRYGSGSGFGKYDDPRMRAYYEAMMRNFSGNGTNGSEWWRNSSDFWKNYRNFNDSEYMRSFYEYAARNFSSNSSGGGNFSGGNGSSSGAEEGAPEHSEL